MVKCAEAGCNKPATKKIKTLDKKTIYLCEECAKKWS